MGTLSVDKLMKTSTGAAEFTLPAADGTVDQVMKTDGAGQLGFTTISADPTMGGDLSGLSSNAQIVANAVTLTELEDGTAGDILYYGASGAPTRLSKGTASQTLQMDGSAVYPAWTTVAAAANNTPAFSVHQGTAQDSQTMGTWIKCDYDTEDFDTDSAYDTATNRFTVPAGKAGKYYFYARVWMSSSSGQGAMHAGHIQYYKNGSGDLDHIAYHDHRTSASQGSLYITTWISEMFDLDAADYIEVYCQGNGGGTLKIDNNYNTFGGFKVV